MNKDLLLLFPVKGVSFSEGYIFSFFKILCGRCYFGLRKKLLLRVGHFRFFVSFHKRVKQYSLHKQYASSNI